MVCNWYYQHQKSSNAHVPGALVWLVAVVILVPVVFVGSVCDYL
jgi:hypothetical protein